MTKTGKPDSYDSSADMTPSLIAGNDSAAKMDDEFKRNEKEI